MTRTDRARAAAVPVLALTITVVAVLGVLLAMQGTTYDLWGGLIIGPLLVALSLPVVRRVARREPDPRIARLLVVALVLKVAMAVPRYLVNILAYDGVGDAFRYHAAGATLYSSYRNFLYPPVVGKVPGTGFIEIVTGVVYAVTDPTKLGGFLVFSWFGFWGLLLFYRAFRVAVPEGDAWRYALLVLLLPSLLFWPSSIGKEAWMMLTLGLTTYGVARLLARDRPATGVLWLVLGGLGTAMVRPHITVLAVAGLVVAYAIRPARRGLFGPLGKVVGVALLLGAALFAVSHAEAYFGVSQSEGDVAAATTNVIDEAARRTNKGGSAFQADRVRSPADLPAATLAVLFRPFPTEANSVPALAASAEGAFVLLLFALSWRRLRRLPRLLVSNAYVAFCVTYTLLFVIAFSSFGNFGILTRQRVQVFPFVLVLLALPLAARARPARLPVTPPLDRRRAPDAVGAGVGAERRAAAPPVASDEPRRPVAPLPDRRVLRPERPPPVRTAAAVPTDIEPTGARP